MKSPLFEGFDYVHQVSDLDLSVVRECDWASCIAGDQLELIECPLLLRRERYDHSKAILHWHEDFHAIYIVRGGRGIRVVNKHAHSMARGDIFLMAPQTTHCFQAPVDLTIDALYFQAELWPIKEWSSLGELPDMMAYFEAGDKGFEARGYTDHFGHLSPELHARVEATLGQIRHELKRGQRPYQLSARARLFALLVQLADWRADKTFATRPARGAGIAEVLTFCDNNFHRALSNEQLAELMNFSEGHFREVFTREVGMSPGAYIGHLRLRHAQELLENKTLSVADIARQSGFSDSSQLGRAFKKAFGISPLGFRKQLKVSA
ncbi:AraC family transcriptional regulator [bacterium]|nr:MAG: AraC family transcriptional regulator [bacterium]